MQPMARSDVPDVRLLYFDGCPNWRVADARLREALTAAGADPDSVIYQKVTVEQAEAHGFGGSPTILVDGNDPFADADAPSGLACRIYRTSSGLRQPAPAIEELQAALER